MSVFSNPAARSREEAAAYTTAILELLGTRQPFDVLRETPTEVGRLIASLSSDQLAAPEAAGKWSMRQVVQHLADSELVSGFRLRMVLAQDRPQIAGYDQDRWAERLRYDEADALQALDDFTSLRRANLRLLQRATSDDLARVGVHAERGEESVAHMMKMYAGHDLLHLRQLSRIRAIVAAIL
jgi:uncharacterized damage-inducible protein DinB